MGTPRMQVVARRWTYAAPPWRAYEALVGEQHGWLVPLEGERTPVVVDATPHERVLLAPWVDRDIDDVEVLVTNNGYGTELHLLAHADHELTDERRREVRHRVGVLFGADLRYWVDGR